MLGPDILKWPAKWQWRYEERAGIIEANGVPRAEAEFRAKAMTIVEETWPEPSFWWIQRQKVKEVIR